MCYRYIAIPSVIITPLVAFQLWLSHSLYFLPYAIAEKLFTTSVLLLYIFLFRSDHFYFFHNLGHSRASILTSIIAIDFLIAAIAFGVSILLL